LFDTQLQISYNPLIKKRVLINQFNQSIQSMIWQEEATVVDANRKKVAVKLPHADTEKYVGCGACEHKCPAADKAGIRISSVGESRNPANQFTWLDRYSG
jgi:ferredoxin